MAKVKVGIMGTGMISDAHMQGYLHNPEVEVYALYNRSGPHMEARGLFCTGRPLCRRGNARGR
jgi:predicted dehydrogenase